MAAMLDLDRIRDAPVKTAPYPYFSLPDAIVADEAPALAAAFPDIDRPGAIDGDQADLRVELVQLADDHHRHDARSDHDVLVRRERHARAQDQHRGR